VFPGLPGYKKRENYSNGPSGEPDISLATLKRKKKIEREREREKRRKKEKIKERERRRS